MTPAELKELAKKIRGRSVKMPGGCLEWQGARNTGGYGVMRLNGSTVGVHRVMLAAKLNRPDLLVSPILQPGHPIYALHSCDNPACCEPKHLRMGSGADNAADAKARNRYRPRRKLSDDAVREIRREGTTWDGMCDMMKKHKVGQLAIRDVVSRKFYKHVPD